MRVNTSITLSRVCYLLAFAFFVLVGLELVAGLTIWGFALLAAGLLLES